MFLLYLDDSGAVNNRHEDYLVLGGICVAEQHVNELTHSMDQLAARFDADDPDGVEFHASEIFAGRSRPWDSLRRKEDRREVLKDVLGIFAAAPRPACALACAVHKASFPGRDPMETAFSELCAWFDGFLKDRHQAGGPDEKGIIFLDQSTYETSLRRIARDFRRNGLTTENGRYIVDGPHFVNSRTTRCVQIADHVAYSVFRHYHAQDNTYLNVVLNRFQSDGKTFRGLCHIQAGIEQCTCPGCLTHRACSGTLNKV